jgi:hypothetical protein
LQDNTTVRYDWSFFLAWLSVAFSLLSSILLFGAAGCLRAEKEEEHAKNVQYVMPGV